jgi:membrane protease YdiL (CAAX protease family)
LSAPAQAAIEPSKSFRVAEVCLVVALANFPYLFRSILLHLNIPPAVDDLGRTAGISQAIGFDLLILLLISYVLSRTGRRFRDLGLNWRWSDVPIAAGVLLLAYIASVTAQFATAAVWTSHPAFWRDSKMLFGEKLSLMVVLYALVNPFFEEIVVRAYLMTEVREITGKAWVAIAVSVGLQSAVHIYQGWSNMIALGAMFWVFAMYFAATRRALPVVIAHLFLDVIAVAAHFARIGHSLHR